MAIGTRLHQWWDKVRGRDGHPQDTGRHAAGPGKSPAGARAVHPLATPDPAGTLQLTVEGEPGDHPARTGKKSAGFDPYANDGGSAKPRAWDEAEPR